MSPEKNQHPLRLLGRKEVQERTGLSRSTIYQKISRREFPAPVPLSARAVAWPEASIDAWIRERIAASAADGEVSAP